MKAANNSLPSSMRGIRRLAGAALLLALAGCVVAPPAPPLPALPPRSATPVYFYPERGQDETRQDRDRFECYRWAVRETGVDPGMTPVRELPPPRPVVRDGSQVVGGAVAGAVVGAAVSSPWRSGEGAVLGAIFGATLGAIAQESRAQAIEAAHSRRAQVDYVPLDNFRRAMSACMEARGYRIG
jgi:hypothetical protein